MIPKWSSPDVYPNAVITWLELFILSVHKFGWPSPWLDPSMPASLILRRFSKVCCTLLSTYVKVKVVKPIRYWGVAGVNDLSGINGCNV